MNWPHQDRALTALEAAIIAGERNICLTCPTGGGKSRIMFQNIEEANVPAALYTDRRMLLSQLAGNMDSRGITYGLRASGEKPRLLEDIQLCMVQTEASRVLSGKREIHPCDRIYIDEAHKNSGDQAQQLIAKHRGAKSDSVLIGVTATPLGIGHLYRHLIVAGTNSELRKCGALVPAYHYGPNEPDTKWVGKVAIGEGECGLANNKRMEFAHRVFGSVVEWYQILNPELRPSILFAPGVKESIWFAEELCHHGISAAHIDGSNIWVDGELCSNDDDKRNEIAERHRDGDIRVVCNRFVLREGIDWPWIYHGIFATVFGSLTSYLQAGGRILRAHESMDHVVIQDHGGCWWRHGSLNEDRQWNLEYTDRIASGLREQRLREKRDQEPIVCPKCFACRLSGPACFQCGFQYDKKSRPVLQRDGSLREMKGDIFRKRRVLSYSEQIEGEWIAYVRANLKSKKPQNHDCTPAQLESRFAMNHDWQYPPRNLPMMPVKETDWFRPISQITEWTTRQKDYGELESARAF